MNEGTTTSLVDTSTSGTTDVKQFFHSKNEEILTTTYINTYEPTAYDRQLQSFLAFSNTVPDIIVSKSTPSSPKVRTAKTTESKTDANANNIETSRRERPKPVRKLSQGAVIDNNFNRVQPVKLERLNSGETARRGSLWKMNRQSSSCSISSLCSVDTNCMSDVSDYDLDDLNASTFSNDEDTPTKKESMWVKLRKAVRWSPFMQNYKKQYPWIQLAGHPGGFKSGEHGTILKKSCKNEVERMQLLMNDILRSYVPEFKTVIVEEEHSYIQMQDLLAEFDQPTFVMDCKMGTRTYLEDEVKKIGKPRQDLYLKMIAVDPSEPTDEENETCCCTKPRYMQWREQLSSTATLGFRIEGIKRGEHNPDKDFKKIKSEEDVSLVFKRFVNNRKDIQEKGTSQDVNVKNQEKYLERLKAIRRTLLASNFFKSHEVIGSSLLFIHDASGKAGIWIIDFGKTVPTKNGTVIDHKSEWVLGNHEDGYLFGLDHMINVWSNMQLENS